MSMDITEHRGCRGIQIPDDTSVAELVRVAMDRKTGDARSRARGVGISQATYLLVRRFLMLRDRKVLTADEEAVVSAAIQSIDQSKGTKIKPAVQMTRDLLALHWVARTRAGIMRERSQYKTRNPQVKAKKRFENTVFAIREACSNNEGLEIPVTLTESERREAEKILHSSIKALRSLYRNIRGGRTS